jgi:hypothetical protein
MATKPAKTECHLTQPNAKSTTAPIEKNSKGVGRFIHSALCPKSVKIEMIVEIRRFHSLS